MKTIPNTHGVKLAFGKHKGELLTRAPVSYLRWMVNKKTDQADLARAEIERRGSKFPEVELSGHAIDNASLRCFNNWREGCHRSEKGNHPVEGLHSWLARMTLEAY